MERIVFEPTSASSYNTNTLPYSIKDVLYEISQYMEELQNVRHVSDVYSIFKRTGIKGLKHNPLSCLMSQLLMSVEICKEAVTQFKLSDTPDHINKLEMKATINLRDGTLGYVQLECSSFHPIYQFIKNFDDGKYPDLEL